MRQGNILGRHKGVAFYTIGQRQGLGVAMGYPVYVAGIDPAKNLITLGNREEVFSRRFFIKNPHFIFKPFKKRVVMSVRIRYNHKEARAELIPGARKIKVEFKKPQFAVAPGQSAVFYDRDTVFGGGIIERIID
jgi:tRNA-specific 2-thiouridylase